MHRARRFHRRLRAGLASACGPLPAAIRALQSVTASEQQLRGRHNGPHVTRPPVNRPARQSRVPVPGFWTGFASVAGPARGRGLPVQRTAALPDPLLAPARDGAPSAGTSAGASAGAWSTWPIAWGWLAGLPVGWLAGPWLGWLTRWCVAYDLSPRFTAANRLRSAHTDRVPNPRVAVYLWAPACLPHHVRDLQMDAPRCPRGLLNRIAQRSPKTANYAIGGQREFFLTDLRRAVMHYRTGGSQLPGTIPQGTPHIGSRP